MCFPAPEQRSCRSPPHPPPPPHLSTSRNAIHTSPLRCHVEVLSRTRPGKRPLHPPMAHHQETTHFIRAFSNTLSTSRSNLSRRSLLWTWHPTQTAEHRDTCGPQQYPSSQPVLVAQRSPLQASFGFETVPRESPTVPHRHPQTAEHCNSSTFKTHPALKRLNTGTQINACGPHQYPSESPTSRSISQQLEYE